MSQKSKAPHNGGASQDSCGGYECDDHNPQQLHRQAALALLNKSVQFSRKEGGFLGHVCVADDLSSKQHAWLNSLLARHGLVPLSEGGER